MSSERAKVLTVDTSDRVMEFVCSEQARAARDRRRAVPRPPRPHQAAAALDRARGHGDRIAELAQAYRDDYRAYFEAHADGDEPGDPDARIILVEGMGMVAAGTTTKAAKISRDLYHRAIEVMAGAEALGEFVSLDAAESFAIEYWPLELYKLAQAPPPGELQGKVALVTGGAGGIGRAILDTLASAGACVVAFDLDEDGARDAVAEHDGLAVAGDVTSEAGRRGRVRGRGRRVRRRSTSSSPTPGSRPAPRSRRRRSRSGTATTRSSAPATSSSRASRSRSSSSRTSAARSSSSPPRTRSSRARTRPRTRPAKAAELHLARCLAEEGGGDGIRVNTVNPDAVLQGSKIWGSSWREERAAAYNLDPEDLDEHYRQRNTLKVSIYPGDIAEAVLHFASERRSGKSTGNILNVDGGVPAAYSR